LSNLDLDTGRPVSAGEYALSDKTCDRLLILLAEKKFRGVTPEIRANILAFYDSMKSPDEHGVAAQVELLRAYKPITTLN
jgi:hypothetical protein